MDNMVQNPLDSFADIIYTPLLIILTITSKPGLDFWILSKAIDAIWQASTVPCPSHQWWWTGRPHQAGLSSPAGTLHFLHPPD